MKIKVTRNSPPRGGTRTMYTASFVGNPKLSVEWVDIQGAIGFLLFVHGKEMGIELDLPEGMSPPVMP